MMSKQLLRRKTAENILSFLKLYRKWVEFAQCGTPAYHRFICEMHFAPHQFTNSSRTRLNKDVVPTVGGPPTYTPAEDSWTLPAGDVVDPELLRTITRSSADLVAATAKSRRESCALCPSLSAMKDTTSFPHHYSTTLTKNCTLLYESMSVKDYLQCDPHSDVLTGFGEDQRKPLMTDHLLIFTAKGLFVRWKQPICFFLTPKQPEGEQLIKIIKEVVKGCKEAGLQILAVPM